MALQVVFDKVSVYRKRGIKDGAEQVTEHEFARGDMLPDWVDPHQAFVLAQTGMAKNVGDNPDPAVVRALDTPAPVLLPEHSAFAVQGTEVTRAAQVQGERRVGDVDTRVGADLPADNALKQDWEDAAVAHGMDRGEAESMRKADLVKEVKARKTADDDRDASLARDDDNATDTDELPPTF